MKEFILIPKNMFEMLSKKKDNNITLTNTKISNKRKKEDLTKAWKTHLPPPPASSIPLNQTHDLYHNRIDLDNRNNNRNNKPPHTSLTDRLILHFNNSIKLNKVKLLLNYFKNIIDEEGNIISPPNTNMNFIDIANTFFNINQRVNEEDLDLYKYLINRLSIPKSLIKNRNILQIIQNNGKQLPLGGFIKIRKRLNKKPKINKQTKTPNKRKTF